MKAKPPYTKHNCPNKNQHTERPEGYLEFIDWAEQKSKSYNQEKCPVCGLWTIWRSKKTGRKLK